MLYSSLLTRQRIADKPACTKLGGDIYLVLTGRVRCRVRCRACCVGSLCLCLCWRCSRVARWELIAGRVQKFPPETVRMFPRHVICALGVAIRCGERKSRYLLYTTPPAASNAPRSDDTDDNRHCFFRHIRQCQNKDPPPQMQTPPPFLFHRCGPPPPSVKHQGARFPQRLLMRGCSQPLVLRKPAPALMKEVQQIPDVLPSIIVIWGAISRSLYR